VIRSRAWSRGRHHGVQPSVLLLSGQPIADALGIVDVEQLAATHPRG
jgi:hypothetical protein